METATSNSPIKRRLIAIPAAPVSATAPAPLPGGEIVVEGGEPAQPGYVKMSGRPTPDGQLSVMQDST